MKKTLQRFSRQALEDAALATPEDIVRFIEGFRDLHAAAQAGSGKSKLISMKVPEPLLEAFRIKAARSGIPYQTQIKRLMRAWLDS